MAYFEDIFCHGGEQTATVSHQHSLIQHLTALRVSCFNVNAVSPTLSAEKKQTDRKPIYHEE